MFREVKNVNVESPKNRSKLLDFMVARGSDEAAGRSEEETKRQREEETEGVTERVTSYCHLLFYARYVCNVRYFRYVRHKRYVRFAPFAPFAF